MRHLLYGLAATAMMGGALGLALLPRLTTDWLWFLAVGALCSAAGAGGWVLAGATAGGTARRTARRWPRPRAGWFLITGALVGVSFSLWDYQPVPLLWALTEGAIGTLLIVRLFPRGQRTAIGRQPGGPVRAPVSRRQEGR